MVEPGVGKPTSNWPSYYVNNGSDVDFVVALRHGIPPVFVVHRLLEKCPWRLVAETRVHKFATTQYTLLGSFGEDNETAEVLGSFAHVRVFGLPGKDLVSFASFDRSCGVAQNRQTCRCRRKHVPTRVEVWFYFSS